VRPRIVKPLSLTARRRHVTTRPFDARRRPLPSLARCNAVRARRRLPTAVHAIGARRLGLWRDQCPRQVVDAALASVGGVAPATSSGRRHGKAGAESRRTPKGPRAARGHAGWRSFLARRRGLSAPAHDPRHAPRPLRWSVSHEGASRRKPRGGRPVRASFTTPTSDSTVRAGTPRRQQLPSALPPAPNAQFGARRGPSGVQLAWRRRSPPMSLRTPPVS